MTSRRTSVSSHTEQQTTRTHTTSRNTSNNNYNNNNSRPSVGPKLVQSFVGTHRARKNAGDTAHMPLFELAALTPKEHQVNIKKLKNFLELNGTHISTYIG